MTAHSSTLGLGTIETLQARVENDIDAELLDSLSNVEMPLPDLGLGLGQLRYPRVSIEFLQQ